MKRKNKELKSGGFGTASLILGIMGLIISAIIFSPLAVIFGSIGMNQNQRYAKAGFILGIVGIVSLSLIHI